MGLYIIIACAFTILAIFAAMLFAAEKRPRLALTLYFAAAPLVAAAGAAAWTLQAGEGGAVATLRAVLFGVLTLLLAGVLYLKVRIQEWGWARRQSQSNPKA